MRTPRPLIQALCVLALTSSAWALKPQEVLVVANSALPESVQLAEHYAEVRGIPAENIIQIKTATGYAVTREGYNNDIRQPLLDALNARGDLPPIRSICLMWGVPVRVARPVAQSNELAEFFRVEAERSHNRLATARQLLLSVGHKFPTPADENSMALADLFGKLPPAPEKPLSLTQLQADIPNKFTAKTAMARKLPDAGQRAIAIRQLLALQMEISGLRGLVPYVQDIYGENVDQAGLAAYQEAMEQAEQALAELSSAPKDSAENAQAVIAAMQRYGGTLLVANHTATRDIQANPKQGGQAESTASVDSELAMIWADDYNLPGPLANPLFWRTQPGPNGQTPIMMTARIDGPSADDARNIIDNSLAAETNGLTGKFYVDAGLPTALAKRDKDGTFARYDELLRGVGELVRANTKIDVIIDTNPSQFPPNTAPQAAMYLGWYSLKKYVPAFTFQQGAVAYHVASFEAMDLRNPNSNQWCPKLIQNGVVATVGAVNEPFLHHFPDHTSFFLLLLTGEFTIAECYWRTIPAASWQMTLIADPLYNPFKANPHFPADALPDKLVPPDNWPPIYQRLEVEQTNLDNIFAPPPDEQASDTAQPVGNEAGAASDVDQAATTGEAGQ